MTATIHQVKASAPSCIRVQSVRAKHYDREHKMGRQAGRARGRHTEPTAKPLHRRGLSCHARLKYRNIRRNIRR